MYARGAAAARWPARSRAPAAASSTLADLLRRTGLQPPPPEVDIEHTPFAHHQRRSAVWRDALPEDLLPAVVESAVAASELEADLNQMEGTFQRTRWLPVEQLERPRFAVEWAIAHLQRRVLRLSAEADGLLGCEWWVQHVRPSSGLHFHL